MWNDNFMSINWSLNFWDNLFAVVGMIVSLFSAFWIYRLSKQLSAEERYQHEMKITKEVRRLKIYSSAILADVSKYHPLRTDSMNKTYYKQGAELYTIVSEHGVQFILGPNDENIPVGLVPFEWIKYVRDCDSEDNKPIFVCEFKGIKWFRDFRSPFREINYIYKNPDYREGLDPSFRMFTTIKL